LAVSAPETKTRQLESNSMGPDTLFTIEKKRNSRRKTAPRT